MRYPKGRNVGFALALTALIVIVVAVPFLLFSAMGLWLPDALPPYQWIPVGVVSLPEDQELRLFQRWDSDFYVSVIVCGDKNGYHTAFVIDADDRKCWSWEAQAGAEEEVAVVLSIDDREYVYYPRTTRLEHDGRALTPYPAKELEADYEPFPP